MRVLRTMGSLLSMTTITAGVAAGDLDPPEAPAPTQTAIEPRTPIGPETTPGIASASHAITEPGSYYLTGNLMGESDEHGILILTDDVTLDLMGFQLLGVEGSLSGIRASGEISGITVRNGTIRDWGRSGVDFFTADECRFQNLTAVGNSFSGLRGGESNVIESCIASQNGGRGISGGDWSVIRNCTARANSREGFFVDSGSVIQACVARVNEEHGFVANPGCVITDCSAITNLEAGIMTFGNSRIQGCVLAGNRGGGIQGGSSNMILDNHLNANGGVGGFPGIVAGAGTRVEGNSVVGGFGVGIQTTGEGFVFRNTARDNGASAADNYDFHASTVAGPIVTTTGAVAAASPWANFSF